MYAARDSTLKAGLYSCGATAGYFSTKAGANSQAILVAPGNFPATAKVTCGKFQLYFVDLLSSSPQVGFGDPSSGAARRNTFCEVLQYIQQVFDFSSIPAAAPIRLYVDASMAPVVNPAGSTVAWFAQGAPFHTPPINPSVPVSGFVWDYVINGQNPVSGNTYYHGIITVNFDAINNQYLAGSNSPLILTIPIVYHDDISLMVNPADKCRIDLYSVLLHEMGHILGDVSFVGYDDSQGSPPQALTGYFSKIDKSVKISGLLQALNPVSNLVSSNGVLNTAISATNNLWLNGQSAPDNYPVLSGKVMVDAFNNVYQNNYFNEGLFITHFDDQPGAYTYREMLSPGEKQDYVMSSVLNKGVMHRTYSKGDLYMLKQILGYAYNPSYYSSNSAILNNHVPYSDKYFGQPVIDLFGDSYLSPGGSNGWGYTDIAERLPVDYSMVNNGQTQSVNIAADPANHDGDNDPISVYPGSLINIRGCGQGNNHNQLTVSANGQIVTFQPKPNFYGKAQFGLNLYDGKQKGAFVIYTIDVAKGTAVSILPGDNLVLNGTFEQGTEVKTLGQETVQNAAATEGAWREGRLFGVYYSDSHLFNSLSKKWWPYGGGISVKNSRVECADAQTLLEGFGDYSNSFPGQTFPQSIQNGATGNARYQTLSSGGGNNWNCSGYYYLGENAQNCKTYKLEFDVYPINHDLTTSSIFTNLTIGFTTDNLLNIQSINMDNMSAPGLNSATQYNMPTCPENVWSHITATVTYNAAASSNILFLNLPSNVNVYNPNKPWSDFSSYSNLILDNISLKEIPLAATVSVAGTPCNSQTLTASIVNAIGPVTYSWTPATGLSCPACATTTANPTVSTTYTVTVTNGCNTATASVLIPGGAVCCNPAVTSQAGTVVLTNSTPAALWSQLGLSPGATVTTGSNIVIDGTFTVNQDLNLNNCPNLYFAPDAKIEITNNSKLTMKGCTLQRLCPQLWNGIIADQPGERLDIGFCTIRDMKNGVQISNNAQLLNATQNTFLNNRIGMSFSYCTNAYGNITQNVFNANSAMAAGQKPLHGIVAYNMRNLIIGDLNNYTLGNQFTNIHNGIYCDVSYGSGTQGYKCCSYNNHFQNIKGGLNNAIYTYDVGTAIFARAFPNNANSTLEVKYSPNSTQKIQQCTKGITITKMHGNIRYAHLDQVDYGISIMGADALNYDIGHNTLMDVYYGITVSGNVRNGDISDNELSTYFQNGPGTALLLGGYSNAYGFVGYAPKGISVSNTTNTPVTLWGVNMMRNAITMNAFAGIGIELRNATQWYSVSQNAIMLSTSIAGNTTQCGYGPYQTLYGISLTNCNRSTIQGNHVDGYAGSTSYPVVNTPRPFVAGISFSQSPNLFINCNHIAAVRYGFRVEGNCLTKNDYVKGNSFNNHIHGMLFQHAGSHGTFGDVGRQAPTLFDGGNTFNGNYLSNIKINRLFGSVCINPYGDKFYTSSSQLINFNSGPVNSSCAYLVTNISVNPYFCPPIFQMYTQQDVAMITNMELAEQIARDSVVYQEYREGAAWLSAQRLYYELYHDSLSRNSSQVLDSFYSAVLNEPLEGVRRADARIVIPDTAYLTDSLLYAQWIRNAREADSSIISTRQQETNETVINELFLKMMERGIEGLDSADSVAITSLAYQCPLIGGTAVYKARALYAIWDGGAIFNDITLCNNAGLYRVSEGIFDKDLKELSSQMWPVEFTRRIDVFPNPTTGNITMRYLLDPSEHGIFQIMDMHGRVLKERHLDNQQGSGMLNISEFGNNIYFYRLMVNGAQQASGKITLIN